MFMLSNSAVSFACLEFFGKTSNYATKSETIFRGISPRFDKKIQYSIVKHFIFCRQTVHY